MNRSLSNVILGGYETKAPAASAAKDKVVLAHQEMDVPAAAEALASAGKVCGVRPREARGGRLRARACGHAAGLASVAQAAAAPC